MQNLYNKNGNENPPILVTAYVEGFDMLQILVEKLAEGNCGFGYNGKQLQPHLQSVEISSVEVFVSGRLILSGEKDFLEIPFVNNFLFTCIKSAKSQFNLTWSCSLS